MLDSIYNMMIKLFCHRVFLCGNVEILPNIHDIFMDVISYCYMTPIKDLL